MCGIAGYVDFQQRTSPETLKKMIGTLTYRGPDDNGAEHFKNDLAYIGLAQARLSIIDLSKAGHQPMHFKNLCIVFNGEIYNYRELKNNLLKFGHIFISNSDTEVILHAYQQWGNEFVHNLVGMFVIVIYDRDNNKLIIFRDRAGVKPLYYFWHNGLFIFASELKALFVHPDFKKKIDLSSLGLYFDFGYIPAPYSIFKDTYKLEPGKYLVVDIKKKELFQNRYWSIDDFYRESKYSLNYNEAKEQLVDLLTSSCNYRMIADVPVGIFLSGGYDSSIVTALLQKNRTDRLKTFTIGFEEGYNEAPFAKKVAQYLDTDHTEYICTSREAQNIIPELAFFYDEPFADSSAIPTMLVSRLAHESVKVALSADAGDELFAGYSNYVKFDKIIGNIERIPRRLIFILQPSLNLLSKLIPETKSEFKHKLSTVAGTLPLDKLRQAAEIIRLASSMPLFYQKKLFNTIYEKHYTKYNNGFSDFDGVLDIALAIDYEMYLQNDILTKVDRASMSVSLEAREPLVDHRLAEFVARLPIDYKYNRGSGKRILKEIVHDYIPEQLVKRPKSGFSLPIYKWLMGDLFYLIPQYLNKKSISESGLFNSDFVVQQVEIFKKGKLYYKPFIWKLLMFQMWYFRWIKNTDNS